jgi:hypothetical protein
LDYERHLSARSFIKVFGFRSEGQKVSLGAGVGGIFSSFLLPSVKREGIGLRYEHQLSSTLFANSSLVASRTDTRAPGTLFNGEEGPYQPKLFGTLGLNYINRSGTKIGVNLNRTGSFYQDVRGLNNRPRFPARTTFDLRLAHEPTLQYEYFIAVRNLFDDRSINFNGFPTDGRRVEAGLTRRF